MNRKPNKPELLLIYEALQSRMNFSIEQEYTLRRLKSGYDGESKWRNFLKTNLSKEMHEISDLTLNINGNEVQIDSLIITQAAIYHIEIKNYSGPIKCDYQKWTLSSGKLIPNPLTQLTRAQNLLNIMFAQSQINLPLKSYLIFTNENLTLYQLNDQLPIILPHQIIEFIKRINQSNSYPTNALFNKISNMNTISKHHLKPNYTFDTLQKGLFCKSCKNTLIEISRRSFSCSRCRCKTPKSVALVEAVEEFILLFPDTKITRRIITEWVGKSLDKVTVQRYLKSKLSLIDCNRGSYYIKKE